MEFKVPNEAGTHALVSSVTNTPNTKNVSFNDPIHYSTTTKKKPSMKSPKKSLLKCKQCRNETFQDHHNTLQDHAAQTTPLPIENNTFQDHATTETPTTIEYSTFQDLALEVTPQHIGNNALQDPTSKYIKNKSFQGHNYSVKDVQDIISLNNAFPQSFDTTGNMPGMYTICLDPSVPPVQHARCKVPIECRGAIEKLLQEMVDQGIITPVTEPMEWVSSLTCPWKPDGSLHICLDPKDLNKAIIWEHYKAPTLDEITHKLNGAKVFSKLDAKDGFWSIHLKTPSSYLTTFNTHKGCYWFLCMPFRLKMSQDVFQMWMDQITNRLPGIIAIHDDICVYDKDMAEHDHNLLQLMKMAQGQGLVLTAVSVLSANPKSLFMLLYLHCRA